MPVGRRSRGADDDDLARRAEEIEELGPYVGLAREIQREVERLTADGSADLATLADAIGRFPEEERARLVHDVFDRLSPDVQWAVLAEAFDDDEIRGHLEARHEQRIAVLRRDRAHEALASAARTARRLDPDAVTEGDDLVLGLFRGTDLADSATRGARSDRCARRLVLRREGDRYRVIEDVFNPRGGLFVSHEYDESTWHSERLAPHSLVRVGAASPSPGGDGFTPALFPGGRVDVDTDDGVVVGRLHLGYALLGATDVFSP